MNLSKVDFSSIHTPIRDPNSLIIQTAVIYGDPTVSKFWCCSTPPRDQQTRNKQHPSHNVASHTKPSKSTTPKHQNAQKKPQKKCKPKNTEISAKICKPKKKKKKSRFHSKEETRTNRHKNERKKGEAREGKLLCLFFCPIYLAHRD